MKVDTRKGLSVLLALMMVFSVFAGMPDRSYATDEESAQQTEEQGSETESCTAEGDGSTSSPYIISTPEQMMDLQTTVEAGTTYSGKYFKLGKDLDMSEQSDFGGVGTSSKPFQGNFDGDGHTITMAMDISGYNMGVFGYVKGSVIENLTSAGSVKGTYNVGGIAGYVDGGSVIGCTNEAEITATGNSTSTNGAGGVIGFIKNIDKTVDAVVEKCVNKGEVTSDATSAVATNYGGIIGIAYGTSYNVKVSDCVNEADVTTITKTGAGGIVGRIYTAEVAVTDCVNKGDISSTSAVSPSSGNGIGGIVGGFDGIAGNGNNIIERCENTGSVSGMNYSSANTGGVAGYVNTSGIVEQSFNKGAVSADNGYVGGVAGYIYTASVVRDCYNSGSVSNNVASSTTAAAGGVVGYMYSSTSKAEISSSYNYGKATADGCKYVGGVAGRLYNTSVNSDLVYANKYLEGTAESGIGTITPDNEACTSFAESEKSEIVSELGSSYKNDLAEPVNGGYPILRWQDSSSTYALNFKVTDKETGAKLGDAQVTIDGQTPEADGSFELSPGTYSYKVTRGGYETVTDSVTLSKKSVTRSVELTSVKHEYTVNITPADAKVTISNDNGSPEVAEPKVTKDEETDTATYVYTLGDKAAYGGYKLSLSRYTYDAKSVTLEATGTDDEMTVKMDKAELHDFTVNVEPENATVVMTNTEFGETSEAVSSEGGKRSYKLVAGEYTYRVKAAGHSTKTGKVTVPDDKDVTVQLEEKSVWDGTSDTDWYKWHPFTDEYEISEPEELAGLAELVNNGEEDFEGKTIVLTNDLDLGGLEWTKIGAGTSTYSSSTNKPFKGTFLGKGHKIKNLTINSPTNIAQGLFGTMLNATVSDLELVNVNVSAEKGTMGGLAGYATSCIFTNITVSGKVEAAGTYNAYVGGVAGKFSGTMTDCVNNADVTAAYHAGGFVGETAETNDTLIARCINYGTITGTNTGSTKTYASGGIVGQLYKQGDTVKYCINRGTVTGGNQHLGGIAGSMSSSTTYKYQVITNCYNEGDVTTSGYYAGGIVGYYLTGAYSTISNCFNAGTLSGSDKLGGIIGDQSSSAVDGGYLYNNYYVEGENIVGSRTSGTAIDNEAFTSFEKSESGDYSELVESLGSAFAVDEEGGFPILRWEDPNSTYQASFKVSYDDKSNISDENPVNITLKDSDGKVVEAEESGVYELLNGTYTYTVSRKGYSTAEGSIKVNYESLTEEVKLTAEKYAYTITVADTVDFTLEKQSTGGHIAVANPEYEDGSYTFYLTNGTYEYTAKELGYIKETGEFTVDYAGGTKTIELKSESMGKVSFNVNTESGEFAGTDPEISVYSKGGDFDGKLMGTYDNTSKISEGLQFPAGDYTYKVKAEGYNTVNGEFTVTGGTPVEISETMTVKTGWGGAEDVDTDWYDDAPDADSYTLKTEAQLAGLAKLVNNGTSTFTGKTIKLAKDMNMADNAWTPIGAYSASGTKMFCGTFDGQGHSIIFKNGEIKASEQSFGVFGYLKNATIKNLTLQGSARIDYTGTTSTTMIYGGGLAGYAGSCTIENCGNQMVLDIKIIGENGAAAIDLGGLVGWGVGTSFDSCYNIAGLKGDVTGAGNTICYVGGIVGFENCGSSYYTGTMNNCYNTGEITASGVSTGASGTCYAGGLVGNLSASYFKMSNCYSAADVSAAGNTTKTGALAAYASGTTGSNSSFTNNYYLDNGLTDPTPNSAKRTDAEMKAEAFVEELGDGYAVNGNGGYPILAWDRSVNHIAVTTMPEKLEYNDLSNFDDTGMKITAYMSEGDSDGQEVTSGWTVKNGKKLSATQKSVTIEYKGAEVELPITVNQVTHDITSDELSMSITAPKTGNTPQSSIKLTGDQAEKYKAEITWTRGGKEFEGEFEGASYYRAHVVLTSRYAKDDVYYVFERGAYPQISSAYEIRNYEQSKNEDGEKTVTEFDVTFKATSNASKGVEDKVSHLYYEGDKGSTADYGALLDNELTVKVGDKSVTYTVRDLEQMVLEDGIGIQGEYGDGEYAGIGLYELLLSSGLTQNAADDTYIVLYGESKADKTRITVGELRSQNIDETAIIAYGNAGRGTPIGKGNGPLRMIQKDGDAKSRTNLTSIEIETPEVAAESGLSFKVNEENPDITVTDEFGNVMPADKDDSLSYTLRQGDEYSYRVTKENFTVKTGKVTMGEEDQVVEITLEPVWDGKTRTQPQKDEEGYYLIGTAAELMWWHDNYGYQDKVKLTADIALNNGETNSNNWEVLGTTSTYGSSGTMAFQGVFDGQGHVIRNMSITRENTYELEISWSGAVMAFSDRVGQIGMFGYVSGNAEIKDLGVEGDIDVFDRPDQIYADWLQVGGIAGFVQGSAKISGCYTNVGIKAVASLETESVGGYPLGGYGYACDTYIGGIAGSLSGTASIDNCYTKGTYIGAETRQVTIGGIAGALRYTTNSITDCYSTANIDSRPLSNTDWTSYIGGIVGNGAYSSAQGPVKGCYALNTSLKGNGGDITAGKVAGNGSSAFSGNYGLDTMKITGADLNKDYDGESITAAEAKEASTYSGWDKELWNTGDSKYPRLAWQTETAGSDRTASYKGQNDNEDSEWDGYFSELTPPPYFEMAVKVKGYDEVMVKKFTRKEMQNLAAEDDEGTLYYSAVGNGYGGRVVKEYVYLDTLLEKAGIEFDSGDSLIYGNYSYSHDGLMADRYYYPEWTSGSYADAVKIKPVVALKSFGASSGVSKDSWNYYAAQADYLYAYMLTFGQRTPDEYTYGYFTYQQVDATVTYKDTSKANTTVLALLKDLIADAETEAAATKVSEDGSDISESAYYVDQKDMDTFNEAIEAAEKALSQDDATNGSIMEAYEDLTSAVEKFEKARKAGTSVDATGLEAAIALAESMLDNVTISETGRDINDGELWATRDAVDAFKSAIEAAKSVQNDEDASQAEVSEAEEALKSAMENFPVRNGRLEGLAREAALDELTEYTSQLDLDAYRDKEKAQIAEILKTYKEKIENATGANMITALFVEAKAAIDAVKTADVAMKAEAVSTIEAWLDKADEYYQEEQNSIASIVLLKTRAIENAETEDEINAIVAEAEKELSALKTRAERDNTPAAAAGVKAVSTAYKSVKVSWTKDSKAKYYEVYRSTSAKGKYTLVKTTASTSWTNTGLTTGKTYYYKVRAYGTLDGQKLYGGYSSVKSVKPVPAATKVTAKAKGTKKIKVKWKKVTGASGYQVYRATSKNGTYKKVATIKSGKKVTFTNKKLKKNKKYYYKVRAYTKVKGKKVYGTFSSVKSARAR